MNDIALGDSIRDVARDVDYIRTEGEYIGLFHNIEKSETISRSDTSKLTQAGTFHKFAILRPEDNTLLGTSLSRGSALDSNLDEQISKVRSAVSRLRLLPAQKALILLRSSFNIPRHARPALLTLLWASPSLGA